MPDTQTPSPSSLAEAAVSASKTGNWAVAAQIWMEFCTLQPDHVGGLAQKILALGASGKGEQAEAEISATMARLPGEFDISAVWPRLSEARQDWAQAYDRWQLILQRFPDRVVALQGVLMALREMRRFNEAEEILTREGARFQASFELATAAAHLAGARQDWTVAEARWRAVRHGWPDRPAGYIDGAAVLRNAGRLEDAEALLNEAASRFGATPPLMSSLAQLAEARKNWDQAVIRWRVAAEAMPSAPGPNLSVLHNLLKLGRQEEVDVLILDLAERFPDSHEVKSFQAMRAETHRAWAKALDFWQKAASLAPARVVLHAHIADSLRRLERYEEAEQALAKVLPQHPRHVRLLTAHAHIAQAQSEWAEAKRRWKYLLEIDPANDGAGLQLGIVNYQINALETDALSEAMDASSNLQPLPTPRAARTFDIGFEKVRAIEGPMDVRRTFLQDMFMQMENLGDNCEFGLVQRRFGAEPLGLLRWTGTPIRLLAQAFDADLEGVGLLENTRIALLSGDEYYTSDVRYGMRMHTFIFLGQAEPDALLIKLSKRIQFLRRKLLDDLMTGNQKLFVYKSLSGYQSGDIETLHGSLQRHGKNTLMCVKISDAEHPDGTVEQIAPTLLIGYIKRFNNDGGTWVNTEFDSWATISSKAYHLWQAQREKDAERESDCAA